MDQLYDEVQNQMLKYLIAIADGERMMDIHKINLMEDPEFIPFCTFCYISCQTFVHERYIDAQRLLEFLHSNDFKEIKIEKTIEFIKDHNILNDKDYQITDKIQFSLASLIAREIELTTELEIQKCRLLGNSKFSVLSGFKAIDIHDSGFIDLVSLKLFCKQHGHYLTDEDMAVIISRIGKVQELVITYAAFSEHFEIKEKAAHNRSNSRSPALRRKFISPININDLYESHTTRSHREQNKLSLNEDLADSNENAKTSIGQYNIQPRISNLNILCDDQGLPQRYTEHTPSKEKSLNNEGSPRYFGEVFKFLDYGETQNINIKSNYELEASPKATESSLKEIAQTSSKLIPYRDTYSSFLRKEYKSPKNLSSNKKIKENIIPKPKQLVRSKKPHGAFIKFLYKILLLEKRVEECKIELTMKPDFTLEGFFKLFEFENTGYVYINDIMQICSELSVEIDELAAQLFIQRFDKDKDGKLSFYEFCDAFSPIRKEYANMLCERDYLNKQAIAKYRNCSYS